MKWNKKQAPKLRKVIKDDKIMQILQFWKKKSNQPLYIRDIKEGVWNSLNETPPSDTTISKVLIKDLNMSYRTLSILHPKTQANDHIRTYWEAAIIQINFEEIGWEAIFIDEFCISSHRNKFRGWAFKDRKPIISSLLDSFSMYFVLVVSSQHIYGVLANERANTATIFMYFLENLLKTREKFFKKTN